MKRRGADETEGGTSAPVLLSSPVEFLSSLELLTMGICLRGEMLLF